MCNKGMGSVTGIGKNKKTTIYDLAELTGVSASAVSAILSGNWKKRRISASTAEKVSRIAQEQGYALNRQASMLRTTRSKTIGMIVPKYDNRYFGSIVEKFEQMARDRGLFPVITCTQRDPDLELEAVQTMLSWQVDYMVVTGATDPDRITVLCQNASVPSLNLDLPGSLAPSIISDNFNGALSLTRTLLEKCPQALIFIGGRASDHNSKERLRGFLAAHQERQIAVPEENVLLCGYEPEKAQTALKSYFQQHPVRQFGLFVNSTISLEGVVQFLRAENLLTDDKHPVIGCFDWDPFVALLCKDITMVKQDVASMMDRVFSLIESGEQAIQVVEVPVLQI